MSLKAAVLNIPFGGSMGGIVCDPHSLSHIEMERLTRAYITSIYKMIGPNSDVFTPHKGTNAQVYIYTTTRIHLQSYSAHCFDR